MTRYDCYIQFEDCRPSRLVAYCNCDTDGEADSLVAVRTDLRVIRGHDLVYGECLTMVQSGAKAPKRRVWPTVPYDDFWLSDFLENDEFDDDE